MEKIEDFTPDVINRLMKQIDFFNEFDKKEMQFVLKYMDDFIRYQADEKVLQEGEHDDAAMYVVLTGRCLVSLGSDNALLGEIQAGDFFGEISFFDRHMRTASITATEVSVLWKISHDLVEEATVELKNKIYKKIIHKLTRTLTDSNQKISNPLI